MKTLIIAFGLATLSAAALAQPTMRDMPQMPTASESAALAAQGARPGDEAMTCDQIGMEMQPYAQTMMPGVAALGQTAEETRAFGERQKAAMAAQMGMGMVAGVASSFLPGGGFIAQAQMAAQATAMQKQAAEAKPLQDKMLGQSVDLATTMAPMQQDPRFQRLMQMAETRCKDYKGPGN
jgi:hypothetical protein